MSAPRTLSHRSHAFKTAADSQRPVPVITWMNSPSNCKVQKNKQNNQHTRKHTLVPKTPIGHTHAPTRTQLNTFSDNSSTCAAQDGMTEQFSEAVLLVRQKALCFSTGAEAIQTAIANTLHGPRMKYPGQNAALNSFVACLSIDFWWGFNNRT